MGVFTVNANNLVCDLYTQLRGLLGPVDYENRTYKQEGMIFSISGSFYHHGRKEDDWDPEYEGKSVHVFIHFILCGNVHVWAYVGPESDPYRIPVEEWGNPSNHDSCWRSDGVDRTLTEAYFTACDEVQSHIPEELQVAPKDIHQHNNAGGFLGSSIFSFADVTFKGANEELRYPLVSFKHAKRKLVRQ